MIRQLFQIKRGEGRPVLLLFAFSFLIVAASITGKTARDTVFLSRFDLSYLPLMFAASAVCMGIFVTLYSKFQQKRGSYRTLMTTGLISVLTLTIIQIGMGPWMIPVFYVAMEIIATILAFQVWTLAGEFFDSRQAKRLYGILAAGGSIAFILVGIGLQPFIARFGSRSIILLTIGLILAAMGLAVVIKQLPHQAARGTKTTRETRGNEPLLTPYLKTIILVTVMIGVTATLVDYQFKIAAGAAFPDADHLAEFFGKFYALAGLASLVMQLFITARLLSKFGIIVGLLFLPVSLTLGFSLFLIYPVLLSAFVGKFAEQTFTFTLHQPTIQLLWLPVKKWRKQIGKPLIDGTIRTTVDGLTGVLTYLIIKITVLPILSIIAICASITWIWSAFFVRKGYIATLEEALRTRRLNFEDLKIDTLNQAMVKTIDKTLTGGDEFQQLFALELIQAVSPQPWAETLETLAVTGTPEVRRAALNYSAAILPESLILDLIRETLPEAIEIARDRRIKAATPLLARLLYHPDSQIKGTAAGALIALNGDEIPAARELLLAFINSEDTGRILVALTHCPDDHSILSSDQTNRFLLHEKPAVRKAALTMTKEYPDPVYLPNIIENLGFPATSALTKTVLTEYDNRQILAVIEDLMEKSTLAVTMRNGIISTLQTIPAVRSQTLLLRYFDVRDLPLFNRAVQAMQGIANQIQLPHAVLRQIQSSIRALSRRTYALYQVFRVMKTTSEAFLILDWLQNEIDLATPILIRLGSIKNPPISIDLCLTSLQSGDPHQVSYGLELLETIFTREERDLVTPLIEPNSVTRRAQIGRRHFKDLTVQTQPFLLEMLYDSRFWNSVISLDFILKHQALEPENIHWDNIPGGALHQEVFNRAAHDGHPWIDHFPKTGVKFQPVTTMYSTLEKTILLKSIPLFKTIPAEVISSIALIAEEVPIDKDRVLFRAGDPGDAMYVIVEGNILIHRGDKQIATLGQKDCLGEMALLDEETRSADATARTDGMLLKISQDSFSELLDQNPDIMHTMLKLFSSRLRKAIQ